MKKSYTKTGRSCRVTFELPGEVKAKKVALRGDFNDWDAKSHLLTKKKNGDYSTTISLEAGKTYHYRFYLDGKKWENDWNPDGYAPNPYGGEDSIVIV